MNAFSTFLWIFILTCGSGSDIFLIKILNFLFCFIFHSCWNYKSERNNSGLGQGHWGTTSQCYKLVWMLYKLICCSRIPCDISQNIFCISTTSGNYLWTSNFLRCFKPWKAPSLKIPFWSFISLEVEGNSSLMCICRLQLVAIALSSLSLLTL